jgi:hypothetical protein
MISETRLTSQATGTFHQHFQKLFHLTRFLWQSFCCCHYGSLRPFDIESQQELVVFVAIVIISSLCFAFLNQLDRFVFLGGHVFSSFQLFH